MNRCIGCGITLQNKDKNILGYTKNLENKYCERCFRTIHYNEEKKIDSLDNNKIIQKINKLNKFTIFITDLTSINNNLISLYKSIKNDKVFIINKCDIIPDTLKLEHLEDNIKSVYNIKEDIFFISAKKRMYLNKLINLIESNKEVIFCGETSSGKSTLINNLTDSVLTTSKYNNTTLDIIKIKYFDYIIYDTPGILLNDKKTDLDKIICSPKNLKEEYIFKINDLIIKSNSNLTFIIPNNIVITSKKEDIKLEEYIILDNSDIILPNGGFIYIKNKTKLYMNQKLEIRKSIIGR